MKYEIKANLSTKSIVRIARKLKLAHCAKSWSKYKRLPKRCRATCGKLYKDNLIDSETLLSVLESKVSSNSDL